MRRKANNADIFFIKKHPHMNAPQVSEEIDLNVTVVQELQDKYVEYTGGFAKNEGTVVLTSAASSMAEESKNRRRPGKKAEGVIVLKPKKKT